MWYLLQKKNDCQSLPTFLHLLKLQLPNSSSYHNFCHRYVILLSNLSIEQKHYLIIWEIIIVILIINNISRLVRTHINWIWSYYDCSIITNVSISFLAQIAHDAFNFMSFFYFEFFVLYVVSWNVGDSNVMICMPANDESPLYIVPLIECPTKNNVT